jgi:AraC family transcriptional regulator
VDLFFQRRKSSYLLDFHRPLPKVDRVSSSDGNRAEYQKRVNRVLDHIRAHRSEELTLEQLAAVAGFSPFHFHRLFKAMTGENLKEHIQRTRLESAASALLTRRHVDILVIALDHGFGSASAFARAFKERFGMSASQWRAGGASHARKLGQSESKLGIAEGNPGKARPAADAHDASCTGNGAGDESEAQIMDVTVKSLPARRVAYMRTIGPYGPNGGISQLWEKMSRWAEARDLFGPDRVGLGIAHDDPRITDPAHCRYDAAVEIPADFVADGDVNVTTVEGGKYAVARFRGPASELGRAYDRLFGQWLPSSGYQPDNRLMFELMQGQWCDPKTGHFTLDICVPVRPL